MDWLKEKIIHPELRDDLDIDIASDDEAYISCFFGTVEDWEEQGFQIEQVDEFVSYHAPVVKIGDE